MKIYQIPVGGPVNQKIPDIHDMISSRYGSLTPEDYDETDATDDYNDSNSDMYEPPEDDYIFNSSSEDFNTQQIIHVQDDTFSEENNTKLSYAVSMTSTRKQLKIFQFDNSNR